MKPATSLADRLRGGEINLTAWSLIPDPMTVEALATTDFDSVTMDMQHGGHDDASVLRCIPHILNAGKPAIVRIPVGRNDLASRVLDFGADAVIAPMINSVADAKAFADAMKYPPLGGRSWGANLGVARRGIAGGQAYLEAANSQTLAFAMIETRQAFDLADEIIAVDGIDGIFVGPSDFSIGWTGGKTVNPKLPELQEAIAIIAAKVKAAGKLSAIYCIEAAQAAPYAAMGFQFMTIQSDNGYMAAGARAMVGQARADMAKS